MMADDYNGLNILNSLSMLPSLEDLATLEPTAQLTPANDPLLSLYYALFIYAHIVENDLIEARFVLRRALRIFGDAELPAHLATAKSILSSLWSRNYALFHQTINEELSGESGGLPVKRAALGAVVDRIRSQNYAFVTRAFESVEIDVVATYLGLTRENTLRLLLDQGWRVSLEDAEIVMPPPLLAEPSPKSDEERQSRLDLLVSFISHMQTV